MSQVARSAGVLVSLVLAAATLVAPAQAAPPAAAVPREATVAPAAELPGLARKAKQKPKVRAVKPRSGPVTGGSRIVIKGKHFTKVRNVTVGGQKATGVKRKGKRKIVAQAPPGFAGTAQVRVKTKHGKSKTSRKTRYTYVDPPAVDRAVLDPAPGTVVATDVLWVTGGTDYDSPQAGEVEPWVVGIGEGGAIPAVGDGFLMRPGSEVFPSGLVGTVTVVASQAEGVTAVTVAPTPITDALDEVDLSYMDPAGAAGRAREITDGGVTFKELGPSSFACRNQNGQSVSFRGSLSLSLENVAKSFDLETGNLFAKGYLSAWVRYEAVLRGKITATGSIKCKIKPAWQNANRRIIPIGTTGATISFAPTAAFSFSGGSTLELTQRSRRMVGLQVFDSRTSPIDVRKNLGLTVDSGSLTAKVDANAGVSVQFGALDRVGVEGKVLLNAEGKLTAKPPSKVCADLYFGVKFSVALFLDVWVTRWESPGYSKTWPFAEWHKCTRGIQPAPAVDAPEITSLRLPTAYRGESYSARLTTSDGRNGTWDIDTSRFPVGLTMDRNTGRITGVPTARVGDYVFEVTFTDTAGGRDNQLVRLYLAPERPVAGGDFQATLTWGSAADLDLYVYDPNGEAVWYGSPASSSGGQLDRDANLACTEVSPAPVENVYWPPGGAPTGRYSVYVSLYDTCGAADLDWRLVVRVRGVVVLNTTGSGSSGEYVVNVGATPRARAGANPRELPETEKAR